MLTPQDVRAAQFEKNIRGYRTEEVDRFLDKVEEQLKQDEDQAEELRRQLADSLEDRPFPPLPETLQRRTYFAFGSAEDHFKYREAVRKAYPAGNFPVFAGYDHMQYQIRDPQGFAELLQSLMERDRLPDLPFLRK